MICELGSYAEPGSSVLLVADVPPDEVALRDPDVWPNLAVEHRHANTNSRAVLDDLDVPGYDRVIVMSYVDHVGPKRAGARALLTLLHLRDIARIHDADIAVVSEIADPEDADLVRNAGVNDIVVSDEVLSLMLTQVAENHHLAKVYQQLFQAAGSEIYLRPVDLYVTTGAPVSFATLIEAASRRSETAIGYWSAEAEDRGDGMHGIRVNPFKQQLFDVAAGDRVIVLAEQ